MQARVGPGLALIRSHTIEWTPLSEVSGAAFKLLHQDDQTGRYTALLSLDPGARLPGHKHSTVEEIYVIDGTAVIGAVEVGPGAYCRSEPGSVHGAMQTPDGCTLFVIGCERDELLYDDELE